MITNSMPPCGRCRRRMGAGRKLLRQFRPLFSPGHTANPRYQCYGDDDHRGQSYVSLASLP